MPRPSEAQTIINSRLVREELTQSLNKIRRRIIDQMMRYQRNARGYASKSLHVEVTGVGGTLYGVQYYAWMERGRRSGYIPKGFTDIMVQWIQDKGISITGGHGSTPEKRRRSVAAAMAHEIMLRGTSLHQSGNRQNIYSDIFEEEVQKLAHTFLLDVGSSVDYIEQKYANIDKQ